MSELNTEQIIKALEKEYDRHHKLEEDLKIELNIAKNLKNALALIKDLQAHNENLKKENKYLRERLAEEMEHKEDMKGKDNGRIYCKKSDT